MRVLSVVSATLVTGILLWLLTLPVGGTFRPGPMLEPWNGLYATARSARPHNSEDLLLAGMDAPVRIEMDDRGVPHLFAGSAKDATMALGYTVARDRLFEMEFIWRAATGRLSEMLGEAALEQDRHFLDIGMAQTVRKNTSRQSRDSTEINAYTEWYVAGANAWLNALSPPEWPFEYRLFGVEPSPVTAEYSQALFAFMAYDLSFHTSDAGYARARALLEPAEYERLYPEFSEHEVYIVPSTHRSGTVSGRRDGEAALWHSPYSVVEDLRDDEPGYPASLAEGFKPGKGSNNWAVNGSRSSTGMPILAGDMHLNLSLPAIWYEVHMVTPDLNTYGVTFPSAPAIVEGITETHAWAFTNTGSDQLDSYVLTLDDTGTKYLYDGEWRSLVVTTDTIRVRGAEPLVHEVQWSHHGPVRKVGSRSVAMRWVGHEYGHTLQAIVAMNAAVDHASFDRATRLWDYPMQNILYAGRDSVMAIRSTGYLPVRADGVGDGFLDGSTSRTEWLGRVPFDELPAVVNPASGFITSTNQRPAGREYPFYMGNDWRSIHRSQRIQELLSGRDEHSADDLKTYQADVYAKQADYLIPVLGTLHDLPARSAEIVDRLTKWDRHMAVALPEATMFASLVDTLESLVWDEPVFAAIPDPVFVRMFDLDPEASFWFDMVDTPQQERFSDVLTVALARQSAPADVRPWGDVHTLSIRHITRSTALRPLWREGMSYPGWRETLSPARGMAATHSASWRVVVDLSTDPPSAWGVYPGGQSGNPFSSQYDDHVETFTAFQYYALNLSRNPGTIQNP